jgi:hypothetical protein
MFKNFDFEDAAVHIDSTPASFWLFYKRYRPAIPKVRYKFQKAPSDCAIRVQGIRV